MIRSQPILLGKMMLEERFVLFSVRSGGFVNQYSLFTDLPGLDTFIPEILQLRNTPLVSG